MALLLIISQRREEKEGVVSIIIIICHNSNTMIVHGSTMACNQEQRPLLLSILSDCNDPSCEFGCITQEPRTYKGGLARAVNFYGPDNCMATADIWQQLSLSTF